MPRKPYGGHPSDWWDAMRALVRFLRKESLDFFDEQILEEGGFKTGFEFIDVKDLLRWASSASPKDGRMKPLIENQEGLWVLTDYCLQQLHKDHHRKGSQTSLVAVEIPEEIKQIVLRRFYAEHNGNPAKWFSAGITHMSWFRNYPWWNMALLNAFVANGFLNRTGDKSTALQLSAKGAQEIGVDSWVIAPIVKVRESYETRAPASTFTTPAELEPVESPAPIKRPTIPRSKPPVAVRLLPDTTTAKRRITRSKLPDNEKDRQSREALLILFKLQGGDVKTLSGGSYERWIPTDIFAEHIRSHGFTDYQKIRTILKNQGLVEQPPSMGNLYNYRLSALGASFLGLAEDWYPRSEHGRDGQPLPTPAREQRSEEEKATASPSASLAAELEYFRILETLFAKFENSWVSLPELLRLKDNGFVNMDMSKWLSFLAQGMKRGDIFNNGGSLYLLRPQVGYLLKNRPAIGQEEEKEMIRIESKKKLILLWDKFPDKSELNQNSVLATILGFKSEAAVSNFLADMGNGGSLRSRKSKETLSDDESTGT